MYNGYKIVIHCKEEKTVPVDILRGVKQGDSLSPIFFNLILNLLIGTLDETTKSVWMETENISVLSFINDLVLLAKNSDIAEKQNSILSKSSINSAWKKIKFPLLSAHLSIRWRQDVVLMGRQCIPFANPENMMKWEPLLVLCKASINNIKNAANSVKRFKLKPKYIHMLVANPSALVVQVIDVIDHEIKQIIKTILRLHPFTMDGVIYTDKSHDGLGIQKVANIVKLAKLKNTLKMREFSDPIVQLVQRARSEHSKIRSLQWSCRLDEIEIRVEH